MAQMAQKCDLCNLEFKNGEQLQEHMDGKRHKKLESIKEDRAKKALRCIFVSGLRKDTFIKQLEQHFSQFGQISKVIIDQEKNAYAIIEFESEESAEKAINCKEHRVNEKNLKVQKRQIKEFVSRVGNNAEKKKELMDKLKEEALFDEQVETLIEHLQLEEEQFKVRQSICDSLTQIFKQYWDEKDFKVVIFGSSSNKLACKGSDMDLTILFNDYLSENRKKQVKLPKIVVKQIKQQQEKNKNSNHDSSDSNMADDVETEMDENVELTEDGNEDEANNADGALLKESINKFFNKREYKEFLNFELEHQVKIIARIIQRQLSDLKQIKTITNTRCPLVRFVSEKTNINCDLSINNFLAHENSKLIRLYMNLEPSLRKLVFLIRYWSKQKNIFSSSRFNSYTLTWLIIFFMQTKKIGFLPTVEELARMKNQVNEIHGWHCEFEEDIAKIMSFKKQEQPHSDVDYKCVNNLLKGFFEFYSSFEFSSPTNPLILCTRSAQLLSATEKHDLTKTSSFINIQDPFDLSHNLSGNISKNTVERLIAECKGSNELLVYSSAPRRSLSKGWGLILLMTKKALPVLSPTSAAKSSAVNKDIEKSLVKLKLFDDTNEPKQQQQQETKTNDFTVRKAIEFVLFLFKDCLLFEQLEGERMITKRKKRLRVLNQICDQVDSLGLNCSPKRLKTANASNDPNKPTFVCVFDENLNNNSKTTEEEERDEEEDGAKIVASFQIYAKGNTWQGRRAVKRSLKQALPGLNNFELEVLTSRKIMELSSSQGKRGFNFRIRFSVIKQENNLTEKINESSANSYANLQIKFDLLDEVDNQSDLIEFTTLVHFMDVFINNSFENCFTSWTRNEPIKV